MNMLVVLNLILQCCRENFILDFEFMKTLSSFKSVFITLIFKTLISLYLWEFNNEFMNLNYENKFTNNL